MAEMNISQEWKGTPKTPGMGEVSIKLVKGKKTKGRGKKKLKREKTKTEGKQRRLGRKRRGLWQKSTAVREEGDKKKVRKKGPKTTGLPRRGGLFCSKTEEVTTKGGRQMGITEEK